MHGVFDLQLKLRQLVMVPATMMGRKIIRMLVRTRRMRSVKDMRCCCLQVLVSRCLEATFWALLVLVLQKMVLTSLA